MLGLKPGWLLWALRAAAFLLALSFIAARLLVYWDLNFISRTAYWVASLWMGILLFVFMFCLITHVLSGILHITPLKHFLEATVRFDSGRILFAIVVLGSLILSCFSLYQARCKVQVTDLEIPVKGTSSDLDGFTIVQISDVHLGIIVHQERMEQIVREINSLNPDIVFITGDLMDENADRLLEVADSIRHLKTRFGLFAVTGNHEYYAGAEQIIKHASEIGLRFLTNEKVVLPNGLILYGFNDPTSAQFGQQIVPFERVIGSEAQYSPAVLLYHQPRLFEKAAMLNVDLMLSGHTHKGQIWPLEYISRLIYPYQTGHFVIGKSHLYVSRGIGTWGPPMRLNSPPELVRIRLRIANKNNA